MACRTKVPFKTLPLSAPAERAFKIKQFQKEVENNTGQSRFYIFPFCNSVPSPSESKHSRVQNWPQEKGCRHRKASKNQGGLS